MFKDNQDFYPTPEDTIEEMGIECRRKIVLEPQKGKGDIVKWLFDNGAEEVLTCELNKDLAQITHPDERFLKHDFLELTAEEISHIDMIVMNPPFSQGTKHLLHAWNIAPAGCEIISLINSASLENDYTRERKELLKIIETYGTEKSLGDCFNQAERKTPVVVYLVTLYKPAEAGEKEFEGFFTEEDEQEEQGNGIMKYNAVRDVVQRYIASVKCYDECVTQNDKLNVINAPFSIGSFKIEVSHNHVCQDREEYKKALQKSAWDYIFSLMNLQKYVTAGVKRDINKFVEKQTKYPFTMRNIYAMFDIIVGTREATFNKSLVEAIDNFTRHTDENRYNVEGWKTNEGHLLNMKFIVPYMVECSPYRPNDVDTRSSNNSEQLQDLVKVICSLTGTNYDNFISLHYCIRSQYELYDGLKCVEYDNDYNKMVKYKEAYEKEHLRPVEIKDNKLEWGKWADWTFFEIKPYKKGTLHIKFKSEDVWAIVNRAYGKIKGQVLPEKMKPAKN